MITRGPKTGTLLKVKTHGLLGATLVPINRNKQDIRWYIFDNIAFLEKDTTLLYLGDETLMVSHWELVNHEDYYNTDEYYKKFLAAVFLHNDKKIYIFYDDHYDLWEPDCYLTLLK
jgi:hypothetical protein